MEDSARRGRGGGERRRRMERRIRGWRDRERRGDRARKEQVAARILGL